MEAMSMQKEKRKEKKFYVQTHIFAGVLQIFFVTDSRDG